MNEITLTKAQIQEISGRLDAVARAGLSLAGAVHIAAIAALFDAASATVPHQPAKANGASHETETEAG